MTTIAPGTPLVGTGHTTAVATAATPHQPAEGFGTVDDAVNWRQTQLWLDPTFDRARPRAATAVAQGEHGFELLDLDASLRVSRSNHGVAFNEPVAGFHSLDDRVVAVLDGLGARVAPRGVGGAGGAADGAMLAMRAGAPPHVTIDGAAAEAVANAGRTIPRGLLIGGVATFAVGAGIAGYLALSHRGD